MSNWLRLRPAATPAMLAVFDDTATVAHGCAFVVALAKAQAVCGVIAPHLADAIVSGVASAQPDTAALAEEVALAGTFVIPLMTRLRGMLGGAAGRTLHLGATSQDVADTVMMVQVRAAQTLLTADVRRITAALARHAKAHATSPAIGRALLQEVKPIAFGLRLAQAARGVADALAMLNAAIAAHAVVQLGGAAGTRAEMDDKGLAVAAHVADTLGLAPAEPWQTRRTGVAAIGAGVGILIGAIGKIARDVSLMAQPGIGEAQEPPCAGRDDASAMRDKRNTTGCQVALSAAIRAPGLVASLLGGLVQEQERGFGDQAEGPVLTDLFLLASGSAAAVAMMAEGLEIDEVAIARNLTVAQAGVDIGESAAIIKALLTGIED